MIRSRGLRILLAGAAAVALLACAWVSLGNLYAAKREREATQALDKTFGSRSALEMKYASADTNAEARKAEELAKTLGSDLSLGTRESRKMTVDGFSEKERAVIFDFVKEQLGRPDDSTGPPPRELEAILEKRRVALTTFEEFLISSLSPKWAFDPRADLDTRLEPNALGHIRIQRLMVADALAFAAHGNVAGAARALDASWKLNEGLAARPEMVSQIIVNAVARLEAGALRKTDAPSEMWRDRLEAMGSRARLVDALVIEHGHPVDGHAWYRRHMPMPEGVGWWWHNLVVALEEPGERFVTADYSEAYARALAGLRDGPAFAEAAPEGAPGRGAAAVILSIAIPNLRNYFERADRLALDAELTTKILRMKETRRARGAWPEPSPEIAASQFPGLSWKYSVADDAMTISLAATLPEPKIPFVLPTSFSSRAPAP